MTSKALSRNVLLVDLDGTLTDPAEGIVGGFRHALAAMGCEAPSAETLGWIIGPPLRGSFASFLGGPEAVAAALAIYRARYGSVGLYEASVYAGVREALADLRRAGATLLLCTGKPIVYADRVLARFGLADAFAATYGAELDGRFEDKGDLIAHILVTRDLDAGACCMWGDRRHDVAAAARHGIPTLGALWGYGGEAELSQAGAAALLASPGEALAALRALA